MNSHIVQLSTFNIRLSVFCLALASLVIAQPERSWNIGEVLGFPEAPSWRGVRKPAGQFGDVSMWRSPPFSMFKHWLFYWPQRQATGTRCARSRPPVRQQHRARSRSFPLARPCPSGAARAPRPASGSGRVAASSWGAGLNESPREGAALEPLPPSSAPPARPPLPSGNTAPGSAPSAMPLFSGEAARAVRGGPGGARWGAAEGVLRGAGSCGRAGGGGGGGSSSSAPGPSRRVPRWSGPPGWWQRWAAVLGHVGKARAWWSFWTPRNARRSGGLPVGFSRVGLFCDPALCSFVLITRYLQSYPFGKILSCGFPSFVVKQTQNCWSRFASSRSTGGT